MTKTLQVLSFASNVGLLRFSLLRSDRTLEFIRREEGRERERQRGEGFRALSLGKVVGLEMTGVDF